MGRYCTVEQYQNISHSIHNWSQTLGHDALKKLISIALSILNHTDKSDNALYAVGVLPPNSPNYADCLSKLQALYDNPSVTEQDVKPVIEYVDSYIALKAGKNIVGGFSNEVLSILEAVGSMLIEKNRKYGDSALNPARIFSRADTVEQLKIRLDSKINRIRNGNLDGDGSHDSIKDLIGYLILLLIALQRQSK